MVIRNIFSLTCALLLLAACAKSGGEEQVIERAFYSMGSEMEFKLYCPQSAKCTDAVNEAHEEVQRLDYIFSNYRDDSVLAEVHLNAEKGPVKVPREFIELTRRSLEFSELTGGAFDITVGKIFELWKKAGETGNAPTKIEIENALKCVGYKKVNLFPKRGEISLNPACVRLDYGAIGKGYAVDKAVGILKKFGIRRGIVNFGGNIYALGPPPGKDGWVIGIKDPLDSSESMIEIIVREQGVATSGDYERFFEIEGKRYSHIIDPRTGVPSTGVKSSTVVSGDAATADALATAFSVLHESESISSLKRIEKLMPLDVFIIRGDSEDGGKFLSDGFKELVYYRDGH